MASQPIRPTRVDFHFDVMCPFAYQTSKWIREVRSLLAERGEELHIDWKFFSLEEVNRVEGKKHPWEREWSYGWSMMRIGALLRRNSMDDCDRWYERAGRALHEEGHRPHQPDVAKHLLEEIGLNVAASAGAACHADCVEISHVLKAMQVPEQQPPAKAARHKGKKMQRNRSDQQERIDADKCGANLLIVKITG